MPSKRQRCNHSGMIRASDKQLIDAIVLKQISLQIKVRLKRSKFLTALFAYNNQLI
jgi:hypothetical protein